MASHERSSARSSGRVILLSSTPPCPSIACPLLPFPPHPTLLSASGRCFIPWQPSGRLPLSSRRHVGNRTSKEQQAEGCGEARRVPQLSISACKQLSNTGRKADAARDLPHTSGPRKQWGQGKGRGGIHTKVRSQLSCEDGSTCLPERPRILERRPSPPPGLYCPSAIVIRTACTRTFNLHFCDGIQRETRRQIVRGVRRHSRVLFGRSACGPWFTVNKNNSSAAVVFAKLWPFCSSKKMRRESRIREWFETTFERGFGLDYSVD